MKFTLILLVFVACCHGYSSLEDHYGNLSRSPIIDWITKFIGKHFKKIDFAKECAKIKQRGEIPSSLTKELQGQTFGYPHFDEVARSIVVSPGATLSTLFNETQNVRVGSRDYVISGSVQEIIDILDCFDAYRVIGSSLKLDGHWKEGGGYLKIQLSNLMTSKLTGPVKLKDDLWEMLFKESMERIIRNINPSIVVKSLAAQIKSGVIRPISEKMTIEKAIFKIQRWLPKSKELIAEFVTIVRNKNATLEEKVNKLVEFVKRQDAHHNQIREKWVGWENVDPKGQILLTLTMYEKPENTVRSTYCFHKASVTMKEIKNAVLLFLDDRVKTT